MMRRVKRTTAAAEQGCPDAAVLLAGNYEKGSGGLPQSWGLAAKWFLKSAEGGNAEGQREIARYYADGRGGLATNDVTAAMWFRKAALQGDTHAQLSLGGLYFTGVGVEKDVKLAEEWLSKAAAQGSETAQIFLRGIARNPTGFDWLKLSQMRDDAEQGDQKAQYELAHLHRSGASGVERDTQRAKKLLKASAAQGHTAAASLLSEIKACSCCGAPRPRFQCQRCREANYCDQECQRKHWSEGPEPHKTRCTRKDVEQVPSAAAAPPAAAPPAV